MRLGSRKSDEDARLQARKAIHQTLGNPNPVWNVHARESQPANGRQQKQTQADKDSFSFPIFKTNHQVTSSTPNANEQESTKNSSSKFLTLPKWTRVQTSRIHEPLLKPTRSIWSGQVNQRKEQRAAELKPIKNHTISKPNELDVKDQSEKEQTRSTQCRKGTN